MSHEKNQSCAQLSTNLIHEGSDRRTGTEDFVAGGYFAYWKLLIETLMERL